MTRISFSSAAALAAFVSVLNPASAAPNSPEIVVDASSGQVIYADEATRPWYPASTTKMMTAYVALRAIKAGQIKLETPLVASARAAGQKPSKLGIRPGQEITLDNALKILMVKSANDLAVVVAEGVGGSIPTFAQMMNNEAARLGMRESRFANPHGFHDPNHFTSARDLAILARALLTEFPEYRGYWGIGAVKLGNRVMKNTNGLIGRYAGAEGMKTGFVCASGFNVVAVANRGGRQLISIVLGAGSGAERTIRAAGLFDKGFSSWGGGYGSLTGLPGSGYGSAPNMRGEICRRGRNYLADEDDSGGAISMPAGATSASISMPTQSDTGGASVYAVMSAPASQRVGTSGGGRPQLGPRAPLETQYVYLGRAPGSTEVARGPGNGAAFARAGAPASAAAFAAAPQKAGAIARAKPQPADEADGQATATAALPGAISQPAPGAIGLRRNATDTAGRPGAIAARSADTGGLYSPAEAASPAAQSAPRSKAAKLDPKSKGKTTAPASIDPKMDKAKADKTRTAKGKAAPTKAATGKTVAAKAEPVKTANVDAKAKAGAKVKAEPKTALKSGAKAIAKTAKKQAEED